MQIVIELDEEYYKAIAEIPNHQCTADMLIIKNGTPLPKGHGDLIDVNDLMPDSDYEDGIFYDVSIGAISGAPKIIEADKEVE